MNVLVTRTLGRFCISIHDQLMQSRNRRCLNPRDDIRLAVDCRGFGDKFLVVIHEYPDQVT